MLASIGQTPLWYKVNPQSQTVQTWDIIVPSYWLLVQHIFVFKLHCNWRGLGWWSQGLGIRVFGCQDLGGLSWSFNGCMNLCTSEICMSFWEGLLTPPHHQKAASKILTSSFSALNRVLEPSVLMELKLSDGKMHTFEVSVLSLNERCFSLY